MCVSDLNRFEHCHVAQVFLVLQEILEQQVLGERQVPLAAMASEESRAYMVHLVQRGYLEYRDLVVKDNQDRLDQLDSRDTPATSDTMVHLVSHTAYISL